MGHTWGVLEIQINMKLLLLLLPLATAVPIKIISYSATEEKHNHEMEGVPGEAVMGEFSFKAPDTGDAVYKLTYTADMDGFQAMGDHLPVSVIMDPVPEPELPQMVDYTPEVAAARAEFLSVQEEIMARHAAEDAENMVDEEVPAVVEDMRRKRRDAEPVVIPTHANVLPTTYHHLAGAYPIYQPSATQFTQLEAAIPFTGSSLWLQLMFLQLLRRVTMNLLPSHYEAARRSCTRSTPRASRNTQTLFNEI